MTGTYTLYTIHVDPWLIVFVHNRAKVIRAEARVKQEIGIDDDDDNNNNY